MAAAGQPGTREGLRIESQTLADLRFAFALTRWPGKIETLALEQMAEGGDRLAIGRPGFFALGVAELLVDPRTDAKFDSLRKGSQSRNCECLCHAVPS